MGIILITEKQERVINMMLLPWLLIGGVIWILWDRSQQGSGGSHNRTPDALERLRERYVNGEIDEETYGRMKRVLERS